MNCRYCGAQSDANDIFCGQCGFQLIDEATALVVHSSNDTVDPVAPTVVNNIPGSSEPDKRDEQILSLLTIGKEYYAAGRYTESLDAYEQAIRLDPNYAPSYGDSQSVALEKIRRAREELKALEKAEQLGNSK
jgi:tetratricopeptide (TPR) repeat protein